MMEQQREFYREMLNQQQENFKCFVQLIMDGTNKRIEGVIRDVQELKLSLEFTQHKMEETASKHTEVEDKVKSFDNNAGRVKQDMEDILIKLDYMENQHKRNNIIIDGLEEEKGENWNDVEHKVQKMLSSNLGLDTTKIEVDRAHRVGHYEVGGRPRRVMVRLIRHKDKQQILSSAKKLKGTKIFINEDFSEAVLQRRRELWPKLKAARERGDKATLRYDKLIVWPKENQTKVS